MMIEMRSQAAQQELAEAQATVSQLHMDLADIQQKSARESESMQAAMHAQADKLQQQLAQVSAGLDEARDESVQVTHTARVSNENLTALAYEVHWWASTSHKRPHTVMKWSLWC